MTKDNTLLMENTCSMKRNTRHADKRLFDENFIDTELRSLAGNSEITTEHLLRKLSELKEDEKYLQMHKYVIYEGRDGKWYTYIPGDDGKGRKKIKRGSERELKQALVAIYRKQVNEPCFPEAFKRWMKERMEYHEISESTYSKYYGVYLRFFPEEEPFCKIKLKDVTESDMERFLKRTIVEKELPRKSFNDLKTIMNGTFKYAKREHWTTFSISRFFADFTVPKRIFAKPQEKRDEDQVFSEQETELLVNHLWRQPSAVNLGLILMFQTGMRVGEAVALYLGDVTDTKVYVHGTEVSYKDLETGKRVCRVSDTTKTPDGTRPILLPGSAKRTIEAIRRLDSEGPYLLMKDGKRVTTKMMNYGLRKACREVGIKERSTHKIRKTYGSILCGGTGDIKLIQRQMGHKDISTTQRFYLFERKDDVANREVVTDILDREVRISS